MHKLLTIFAAWFLLFVVDCSGQSRSIAGLTSADNVSSEYEVIATVLELHTYDANRPVIVNSSLESCTAPTDRFMHAEKWISRLDLEIIYNDCALKPTSKVNRTQLSYRITTIGTAEYLNFFKPGDCGGGWSAFYKKFPKSQGYVLFSRVGFNKDNSFALVEFSYVKGCLDGEGHLLLLNRVKDKWKILDDAVTWVF